MGTIAVIIGIVIIFIVCTFSERIRKFYVFRRYINEIPGPEFAIPFLGMIYELLTIPKEDRLEWFRKIGDRYKHGLFRTWIGCVANVHIRRPEHVEIILRSTTQITKSMLYDYLKPWLGSGLITSTGVEWFHNRKLITPAFHFNILEDFAEVMMEKAAILISCIERKMETHGDRPFDVFELDARCALDIICETAMGTSVDAQEAVKSDYINAIHTISSRAYQRFFRPWLKSDWIYYKTSNGKSFKAAINTAHDLCTHVIERKQKEQKTEVLTNDESKNNEVSRDSSDLEFNDKLRTLSGQRKRKAFLDLLLEAKKKEDNPMTTAEIRDQVNTFMFAGHDTTAALISWTLFCLGNEPVIQRKVHEELDNILKDSDDSMTFKKLANLKYLERIIKEVLRLYPSVTVISRNLIKDLQIDDYIVPAGTNLNVHIYHLHRDATIWSDPLRFDPDRFLPQNIAGTHPYAYIPFSAGPRNCIGQRFAMIEAKVVLAHILENFTVTSIEKPSTIKIYSDLILRPVDGIYVTMKRRSRVK